MATQTIRKTQTRVTYRKSRGTPKRCEKCGAFVGNRGRKSSAKTRVH